MEINKGVESIEEILPLLNKAFKENFLTLLPKLYSDNRYRNDHYTATIDGKLAGALASIPNDLILPSGILKSYGIGMVGVNKKYRGKGVMNALMTKAVNDARDSGGDFMFLSGNRKRYERYGFVPSGYCVEFNITSENIKHSQPNYELTFLKYIKDVHINDVKKIYEKQSVRYRRDDIDKVIHSWNTKNRNITMIIKDSKVVGYFVIRNCVIKEMFLDGVEAAEVIVNYFKLRTIPFLKIRLYNSNIKEIKSLATLAQISMNRDNASFAILNYWNVIDKLLNAFPTRHDYDYVLEIEGQGKRLISERNCVTTVTETELKADCRLDSDKATAALFSPHISAAYNLPFMLLLSIPHNDNL